MGTVAVFLTIAGAVFCIIEFFLPGIGVFAVAGILSLVLSFFLTASAFNLAPFYAFALQVVIFTVVAIISYFSFKKTGFLNKIMLNDVSKAETSDEKDYLIGKDGVCKTPLKPVGTVNIEGEDVEVLSDDGYLNIGDTITVSHIVKNKIFVKKQYSK